MHRCYKVPEGTKGALIYHKQVVVSPGTGAERALSEGSWVGAVTRSALYYIQAVRVTVSPITENVYLRRRNRWRFSIYP